MPSKKKKYNARFPAGRIKKIMQTDEEVGKVAQAVPIIISRTLELFVESLLSKTLRITNARNAKTLSPSHMKQCIMSERRFDFLRDLVKNVPDISVAEEGEMNLPNEGSSSNGQSANGSIQPPQLLLQHDPIPTLQRSESYAPPYSHSISIQPQVQQPLPNQIQSLHTLKRVISHSNSLNFYKEIDTSTDNAPSPSSSSSSSGYTREPPHKLVRLHSAPATTVTSNIPTIPIKIDILPNDKNSPQTPSKQSVKIEPVINFDYTNIKLPMTMRQPHVAPPQPSQQSQQPTFKIDLSNLSSLNSMTPKPVTPSSEDLSRLGIATPSTSSVVSNKNSVLGMDEDYDDI